MSLINENSTTKEILSEIRYTFMEKEFEEYQGIVVRREEDLKTALKKSKEDYNLLKEEHDLLERSLCSSELDKLELEEELNKIKIEFDSLKKKRFSSESEVHYADQNLKKPKIETDEEAVMELRKDNGKLKEEIELYRKKFPEHVNRMACIEKMLADFKEKNASNFRAENVDDDDHSRPDDSISSQIQNSRNSAEIQSSNLQKEGGKTMHTGFGQNTPSSGLDLQNSASDLKRGINEPLTEVGKFSQLATVRAKPQPAPSVMSEEQMTELVANAPLTGDTPAFVPLEGTSAAAPATEVVSTSASSTFPTFPPFTMDLLRDQEDDGVTLLKSVLKSTADVASHGKKRGQSSEAPSSADVPRQEYKRLRVGGKATLEAEFKEEDCAKMSPELLAIAFRHAMKTLNVVGKETLKRATQPQEDVAHLKQKVKDLIAIAEKEKTLKTINSMMVTQSQAMANQKEKIAELEAILQANDADLKSKDEQIQQLQQKAESDGLEIGSLQSQLESLKLNVEGFPSQLEKAAAEAIAKYRASSELDADMTVLMRQAMRGGFVLAVNELVTAHPTLDVSSLETSPNYDPLAETLYDKYFEEFARGERIGVKYGAPTEAAAEGQNPVAP